MSFYTKINDLCKYRSIALTSNENFFYPLDQIYWKDFSPVYCLTGGNKYNEIKEQKIGGFRKMYSKTPFK